MSKLTYDKNCRYCRRINIAAYIAVEIAAGVFMGFYLDNLVGIFIAVTVIQPVIWLSVWIVNKTLPMTHHLLLSEEDRK